MFYFARCINIIFNALLAQLVKYDVRTIRKIKSIHAIIYRILLPVFCLLYICHQKQYSVLCCQGQRSKVRVVYT